MKVIFICGSDSDHDHAEKIKVHLNTKTQKFTSEIITSSAHKVPEKLFAIIERLNQEGNLVIVTIAGRSNGLSGATAASCIHPVIACPPFKDKEDFMVNINSTLQMPSSTPVLTILDPKNCALAIQRIFGLNNTQLKKDIQEEILAIKKQYV